MRNKGQKCRFPQNPEIELQKNAEGKSRRIQNTQEPEKARTEIEKRIEDHRVRLELSSSQKTELCTEQPQVEQGKKKAEENRKTRTSPTADRITLQQNSQKTKERIRSHMQQKNGNPEYLENDPRKRQTRIRTQKQDASQARKQNLREPENRSWKLYQKNKKKNRL
ncbi:hypothetical protein Tco_0092775 [Tanacetum coccineum]